MNNWTRALVTGASSGIGEAIARQLHAGGAELIVVARSKDKLQQLAAELGRNTEVLVADLTSTPDLELVAQRVSEKPSIDLVVNNAGAGRTVAFADDDLPKQQAQIDLNVTALVHLTHAATNAMRPSGSGTIINISSVAGYSPVPNTAIYGATKAFVSSFSQAIHEEERPNGIVVTAVAPGFTRTDFQDEAEFDTSGIPDFLWQSAEQVATAALDAATRGKAMVIPGAHNKVLVGSIKGLPTSIQRRLAGLF